MTAVTERPAPARARRTTTAKRAAAPPEVDPSPAPGELAQGDTTLPHVMPGASKPRAAAPARRGKAASPVAAPPTPAAPVGGTAAPAVRSLPLELLDDHPDNPPGRSQPDKDLVASIRAVGLLQPLVVLTGTGGRFTLVAGHRRRAAAAEAGLSEALCVVRDDLAAAGGAVDLAMLGENGRRRGLTALEEAAAYARLRDRDKLSQRAIAERAGVNQSHVSRLLSLLRLPETARAAVALEQVAVADAAQLAQYADQPEAFAAGWTELTNGYSDVRRAVHRAQGMADAIALRAKLAAKGVRLVDSSPTHTGVPLASYYVGVGEKAHAKLDCHVVHVDSYAREYWGCTSPRTHKSTASRTPNDTEAKARAEARERKKAMKARVEAARLVEAWPTSPATAAPLLARALAGRSGHAETMNLAIAWLQANHAPGVPAGGSSYDAEKHILTHGDDRLVIRYGCALALAGEEQLARQDYRRWDRRDALYLHRLARQGRYSPSEWERARLREHAGVLDVDALLAADDPTPHLPAQPSLHDELDTEPANRSVQTLEPAGELL